MTATLAQVHLTPRTAGRVAALLPAETHGQLAAVASWADTIRGNRPETSVSPTPPPLFPRLPAFLPAPACMSFVNIPVLRFPTPLPTDSASSARCTG